MLNPFTFLPLTLDKCQAIFGSRLQIRWKPSEFAFDQGIGSKKMYPTYEWEFMGGPGSAVKILHEFAYFRKHKAHGIAQHKKR